MTSSASAMSAAHNTWLEYGTLMRALFEPDVDASLTRAVILWCNDIELFRLLPLLLAAVQRVGEALGKRRLFVELVDAVRARIATCRAVKLRFLLLAQTPGFRAFWDLKLVHETEAYASAWAHLRSVMADLSEDAPSLTGFSGSNPGVTLSSWNASDEIASDDDSGTRPHANLSQAVRSSRAANEWFEDKNSLRKFAAKHLFDAADGVPIRDHIRGLRNVRNAFTASELVDVIMEHANFQGREEAVKVGRLMENDKLITRVSRRNKPFRDCDDLYRRNIVLHRHSDDHACVVNLEGDTLYCWKEFQLEKGLAPVRRLELRIPCDMIDFQSLDFWTRSVYSPESILGYRYSYRMVAHPLGCHTCSAYPPREIVKEDGVEVNTASSVQSHEDADEDVLHHDLLSLSMYSDDVLPHIATHFAVQRGIFCSAVVRKVFSSLARPVILDLQRPLDGRVLDGDDAYETMSPSLFVKKGDNIGQDLCAELMFQCFNLIWEHSPDLFPDPKDVPVATAYEVFPTDVRNGFMEAVAGMTSLKNFDWEEWKRTSARDPKLLSRMLMSAAGSYVGAYILGAADRHQDNIQIQNGNTMLHIDFGFLMGSKPPIDGPLFAIYPEMQDSFIELGVWDRFLDICEDAFIAIRRMAPTVTRACVLLFTKFGFSESSVRLYLTGKLSLNTHEVNEELAREFVRAQLTRSSTDWKTKFKSYAHRTIDPAFYILLERRFPLAVLAMKMVEAKGERDGKKVLRRLGGTEEVGEQEKLIV